MLGAWTCPFGEVVRVASGFWNRLRGSIAPVTVTPDVPAAVPRDDRSWAPGAQGLSLGIVLACVGGMMPIAISAYADLELTRVLSAFLGVALAEAACLAWSALPWVRGSSRGRLAATGQVLLMVVAIGCFAGGGRVGGAGVLGYLAGLFAGNLALARYARRHRPQVEAADQALRAREAEEGPRRAPDPRRGRAPRVGRHLRATLAQEVVLVSAWVIATVTVALVCAVATDGRGAGLLGTLLVGGCFTLWAARRAVGVLLALRAFTRPAGPPRPAWVVLLHDPNPRVTRPLLGVWDEEPRATYGRLPKADHVYRADEDRDDLLSYQGACVVHEAWVDAGRRSWSRPRWVAADGGIALPHRRALLGRWYLASVISAQHPRLDRLSVRAPDPADEAGPDSVVQEVAPLTAGLARALTWRLALVAGIAVAFTLLG